MTYILNINYLIQIKDKVPSLENVQNTMYIEELINTERKPLVLSR